jgi:SPP1 gp7 family putative phage head morphogenesis protein
MESRARCDVERLSVTERERQIYNALLRVFAPYVTSVSQSIFSSGTFDIADLPQAMQRVLIRELEAAYINNADEMVLRDDLPGVDIDEIGTSAGEWAQQHTSGLVVGITDSVRKRLRSITQSFLDTPGMTRRELEERIRAVGLSKTRAEAIAITEVTRAASAATNGLQGHYRERYNLAYLRVWQTNEDDRVCPICGPLDGKSEQYWRTRFPQGPPAHPRCRCATALRLKR